MVNFDEYRDKWFYSCPNCGVLITAYRDCSDSNTCKCGSTLILKEKIEGKHVDYDDSNDFISIHTFKPYYDIGIGKEITSRKEIADICKKNNWVYAGDKELTQETKKNKEYKAQEFSRRFDKFAKELL